MTKNFVPIECNPEIFNDLVHELGVSKQLEFCDVWSIEPDMLSFITRPVYALILVFPISKNYEQYRNSVDHHLKSDYYNEISGTSNERVLWFKQTVGNACGTIAALHATVNCLPEGSIEENSILQRFIRQSEKLNVNERAAALENNQGIEQAHNSVAQQGNTQAPPAEESIDFHYVCIGKNVRNGHLYELDGRRKGPIDHGKLNSDEDALSEKALNVVRGFMEREGESGAFSIVALKQQ